VSESPKRKIITKRNAYRNFESTVFFSSNKDTLKMSKPNTERPEILVNTFGKNAPAIERAGVGARNLAEIKQGIEQKPRLGDYDNSN
jgi:hypothetical protein